MVSPRTNLGPLTTKFTYPAKCSATALECTDCTKGWQAQSCGTLNKANTQGLQDDTDCWPPRATSRTAPYALNGWGYYSPGLECPDGYEPACSATGSMTGDFNFQFSVLDHETVIGCCPSGYTCVQPGGPQTCESIASRGSIQVVSCSEGDSILNWLTLPATFTQTNSDGDESVATMDGVTIRAPLFQLNYQSSDLPSSTGTSSETTGSTREATASNTSDADTEPSPGLSTGAQAGIGVGVGVAGLLLIGAGLYFWRRKRNTRAPVPTEEEPKSELPSNYISEVDGSTPARYPPAELEAATPELEGSHTPSHTVRS
ncbi:Hypothetical protein NCS54_01235400 [Fusarium falciforme]|uniref:Hypothetical protein n=1 Tax=Fusarium falciforme TaxID=195108 RepID=UPI0023001C4A|nr:Hypothetical protein NCS54_01235400 [Fusarium falciforme]KAJ4245590.1 hypothetical protein NW757_009853 [Fusarium falciforme]WAO94756.1 Hypothetical protein NCS54_01235400 [Fusarium falciforme]